MTFWSTETLKRRIPSEKLVNPFDPRRIKNCCYQLAMGEEAVLSEKNPKTQHLGSKDEISIEPGSFALLLTEEKISIPMDSIGFISIRAGIKLRGLVNISGFHVDPGFEGHLKFSVYNAGHQSVIFRRGEEVFMLWYSNLDKVEGEPYKGSHQGQVRISSNDVMRMQGKTVTPPALDDRLSRVERHLAAIKYIGGTLVAIFVTVFASMIIDGCSGQVGALKQEDNPASNTPILVEDKSKVTNEVAKIKSSVTPLEGLSTDTNRQQLLKK